MQLANHRRAPDFLQCMASQKTGGASSSTHLERIGYDCQFIGDIPKDGQCPGCRLVYRYPHQTKCCGKRICEGCVEGLKASSKPCPFPSCNAAKILSFPDKACVQSLGKYKVNCPNRSEGCKWEGVLAKLAFHLNLEPSTDKQVNKVCLLSKKECCFCFKLFEYRFMKTHQSRECPKRPHECAYCHYKASFEEVTHQHSNKCPSAPVTCPNNCEHAVLRCELEHHRNHDCPLEIQQCEFRAVGCQVELPRKDMSDHKREGVAEHSLLLSTTLQKAMADITSLQNEKADVTSLQRARTDITTLQSEKADVTSLQGAVTHITSLQTKKADVTLLQRAVADITSLQGTMESYIARKSRALQDNLDKMQEGMITQSKKIYVGIVLLAIVTVVVTMQSGQHLMTGRMTGMEDQTDFCTFDNCERSSMEGREE